jgi:hypothetical protein
MQLIKAKYGFEIEHEDWNRYLRKTKNDIFKLLPLREEGADWKKHLDTIILELSGLRKLTNMVALISIISKLEAIKTELDFFVYRKTIFEVLSILDGMEER